MRQCDRTVRNKTEDTSRVKALKAARDKRYAVCDRIYRKCYCGKQFNEIPKQNEGKIFLNSYTYVHSSKQNHGDNGQSHHITPFILRCSEEDEKQIHQQCRR